MFLGYQPWVYTRLYEILNKKRNLSICNLKEQSTVVRWNCLHGQQSFNCHHLLSPFVQSLNHLSTDVVILYIIVK